MKKPSQIKAGKQYRKLARKMNTKRAAEFSCEEISGLVSDFVHDQCSENVNLMTGESAGSCGCAGGSASADTSEVDLVIMIDSSTTMPRKAQAVNAAAPAAIEKAIESCGADTRVTWLWVDGAKPGSSGQHGLNTSAGNFTQSHQQYLENIGASSPFYHDTADSGYAREQGADAIADVSAYFDWRPRACRSIFYISDTKLEGYTTDLPANAAAVSQSIAAANANNVTVFAHRADNATFVAPMTVAQMDQQYVDLCTSTGGEAVTGGVPSQALYEELLVKAICNCSADTGCKTLDIPDYSPCVSVSWGASECDAMESHDDEVVCITICNCYSNVSFKNVMIGYVFIKDENGHVPPLQPDGTPSSHIYPLGPICFGDIGPCTEDGDNCASRQFTILNRGAKPGRYQLEIGHLCFDLVQHSQTQKIVKRFEICED